MDRRVFFLLLLGFSFVLSSAAVPASRSLKQMNGVISAQESYFIQDLSERNVDGGMLAVEERYMEGRMDIESSDYPGTGANNNHEPKPPARL